MGNTEIMMLIASCLNLGITLIGVSIILRFALMSELPGIPLFITKVTHFLSAPFRVVFSESERFSISAVLAGIFFQFCVLSIYVKMGMIEGEIVLASIPMFIGNAFGTISNLFMFCMLITSFTQNTSQFEILTRLVQVWSFKFGNSKKSMQNNHYVMVKVCALNMMFFIFIEVLFSILTNLLINPVLPAVSQ